MEFTLKHALVTLTCLMLVSATNLTSNISPITETVQASQIYFNLHAVVCPDPYYGYYGGYHDVWAKIEPALEKIGINLEVEMLSEMYDLWYIMWDLDSEDEITPGTNPDGTYNPDGWDLTIIEWGILATSLLWVESQFYETGIPPAGGNIFPYRNERSDELLWKGQHVLDAETRKSYLWAWQKETMRKPPIINVYYPYTYTMEGSYVKGYPNRMVWGYDLSHLRIDVTGLEDKLPADVLTRLTEQKALIYAVTEDVWMWNPFFVDTYTADSMHILTYFPLYHNSIREPWPEPPEVPDPRNAYSKPVLATGPPEYIGVDPETGDFDGLTRHPGKMRVRVPLRQGVKWSDGDPFDAEDVKFTFDLILNPDYQCTDSSAREAIEDVDYVGGEPGTAGFDPYSIDFILKTGEPYPDVVDQLANTWGGSIIPAHYFKPIVEALPEPSAFRDHISNKLGGAKKIPVIGPFKIEEAVEGQYIKLVRNDMYFGYELGWGPYDINEFYFKWVPDAKTRFTALKLHEVDFGEYPIASADEFEALMSDPTLTITKQPYISSNPVWMNLKNPHLSNRYVRLAIAHAIPYPDIFAEVLAGWGVVDPIGPGGNFITPWHYYTYDGETVHLFNDELPPYEYNIDKAKMYMDMWYYAQVDTDYTKGPVGDADFNGLVELDDFLIWVDNFGKTPAGWTWTPGNDIDPDFDNHGDVNMDDFWLLAENFGKEYPFPGAW